MFVAVFTALAVLVLTTLIYWRHMLYSILHRVAYGVLWPWRTITFQKYNLCLEKALRQYDDFLILILFQHQTILDSVKAFGEGIDSSCIIVGSAFEGCFLPRNLIDGEGTGVDLDFFLQLPVLSAGENKDKPLQFVPVKHGNKFILRVLNTSVMKSTLAYMDLGNTTQKWTCASLKGGKLGTFLARHFLQSLESKVLNSLESVYITKPGGMKMTGRLNSQNTCKGRLLPSVTVSFFKHITEQLDMLPLDPDTWAGDAMTNVLMLWVNLTNWSLSFWQTRIFKVHLVIKCEWPQHVRDDWLLRERFWPNKQLVQEAALSHCHLHPLWINYENDSVAEEMEFEMTFSAAEVLLISDTGPKERQCIVILKALIDKENCSSSVHLLSSFLIKTVFFWVLESMPLSERQYIGRGELLVRILCKMILFFEEYHVPHFFNPRTNLLDSCKKSEIMNTLSILRSIKDKKLTILSSKLFQDRCPKTLTKDCIEKVVGFM